MSNERWRSTYDDWKLRTPEEEADRRTKRRPTKQRDPDDAYDEWKDRQMEDRLNEK